MPKAKKVKPSKVPAYADPYTELRARLIAAAESAAQSLAIMAEAQAATAATVKSLGWPKS